MLLGYSLALRGMLVAGRLSVYYTEAGQAWCEIFRPELIRFANRKNAERIRRFFCVMTTLGFGWSFGFFGSWSLGGSFFSWSGWLFSDFLFWSRAAALVGVADGALFVGSNLNPVG